ncbi:hypothetical protein ACVCAH_32595 [Micromonospora sp. LZ34]
MIKRLDGRYEPGRRVWRRFRAYGTTEAIIGGVTGAISDPDTLLSGRYDRRGRLRYTGRMHPLSWSGQLDRPEPLRYHQVEPTVVADIDVDTAYEQHR